MKISLTYSANVMYLAASTHLAQLEKHACIRLREESEVAALLSLGIESAHRHLFT